jgi:hypothetical protein
MVKNLLQVLLLIQKLLKHKRKYFIVLTFGISNNKIKLMKIMITKPIIYKSTLLEVSIPAYNLKTFKT